MIKKVMGMKMNESMERGKQRIDVRINKKEKKMVELVKRKQILQHLTNLDFFHS